MLILSLIIIIIFLIAFIPTKPNYNKWISCQTCGKRLVIRLDDKIIIFLKSGKLKRLAYLECEDYQDEPRRHHTHIMLKLKGI